MKLFIIIIFSFIVCQEQEVALIEQYHTYSEIRSQLLLWDQEFGENSEYLENQIPYYPNIGIFYKLDTLGYSNNSGLPIWVVKLSSNIDSDTNQDKPKVLILGQCHAEEIYGVEIAMGLIDIFLHPTDYSIPYRPTIDQVNPYTHLKEALASSEIWIVPTHNPEGLQVVHGEYEENGEVIHDVSFRKNFTDTNNNGILDYQNYSIHDVYAGGELDGVDLNRNYGLNWIFGDELDQVDGGCYSDVTPGQHYFSDYDYYKGAEPFSESEVDIIKNIALENNFMFSIAYHSSRSGCVSERVVYPWKWRDQVTGDDTGKFSPDIQEIERIGFDLATILDYEATVSKSMKGNAHDWFYAKTGTIQYLIEAGAGGQEGMQTSDTTYLNQTIKDNLLAAFYLINKASGNDAGDFSVIRPDVALMQGVVKNASSGEVISGASITILELTGPMLENRITDQFGKFRRVVGGGSYTIEVSHHGFETQLVASNVSIAAVNELEINLVPKNQHSIFLTLNNASEAELYVSNNLNYNDTFTLIDGVNEIELFNDQYSFWLHSNGMNSSFFEIDLNDDSYVTIDMVLENVLLVENFDDLNNWNINSSNFTADGYLKTQSDMLYTSTTADEADQVITYSTPIQSSSGNLVFKVVGGYELEWDNDIVSLDIIDSNNGIINIANFTGHAWDLEEYYFSVELIPNTDYHLTITLNTDENIVYRGIRLDSITIFDNDSNVNLSMSEPLPLKLTLSSNYPNPFNPSTQINFKLIESGKISIDVFNIKGEKVDAIIDDKWYASGVHSIVYHPSRLASGNYFYRLKTRDRNLVKKLVYLK